MTTLETSLNGIVTSSNTNVQHRQSAFQVTDTRRPTSMKIQQTSQFDPLTQFAAARKQLGLEKHNIPLDEFDFHSDDEEEERGPLASSTNEDDNAIDVSCGLSVSFSPTQSLAGSLQYIRVFRFDLDEEEQKCVIREHHAKKRAEGILAMDPDKQLPIRHWTKRQQALSRAFIVVEAHRFQKHQLCKGVASTKTQGAPTGARPTGQQAVPNLHKLDLADLTILKMLLHDVVVLIDNKEDIDRFERVTNQLVGMALWL